MPSLKTDLRSPISVDVQAVSFLYYIRSKWRYRKIANAFDISRASVSTIINKVSYTTATHLGPELTKLPTTENKVNNLADKFLETYRFPQCVGAIDDTHVDIAGKNEHYSDCINRKSNFSLTLQAVCGYEFLLTGCSDKMARKHSRGVYVLEFFGQ